MVSSGERTTSSETSITHNNGNLHEYAFVYWDFIETIKHCFFRSFNPYYWKDQDSSMSESERHYDPASTVKEAPLWPSGLTYPPSDFQKTLCQRLLHIGPLSAIFIILTVFLLIIAYFVIEFVWNFYLQSFLDKIYLVFWFKTY